MESGPQVTRRVGLQALFAIRTRRSILFARMLSLLHGLLEFSPLGWDQEVRRGDRS